MNDEDVSKMIEQFWERDATQVREINRLNAEIVKITREKMELEKELRDLDIVFSAMLEDE